MWNLSKYAVSRILIVAGGLCITAAVGFETLDYPWRTINKNANETELSDPPPPVFEYIDYWDVQASDPDELAGLTPASAPNPPYHTGQSDMELPELSELPDGNVSDTAGAPDYDISKYILLGVVKIPGISVSENLFEGSAEQMKVGVGHVVGTAMPGEQGNSVIAGHRTSSFGKRPFRHLDKMKVGDVITVKFGDIIYTYEMIDMFVVEKNDVWVLYPAEDETHLLTLVTCDPVFMPASRSNRLIIRARLMLSDNL